MRRYRFHCLGLVILELALSGFSTAMAGPAPPVVPVRSTVVSASQRFRVTSTNPVLAAWMATQADQMAARLAEWIGQPLPFPGAPLRVVVRADPASPAGRMARAQGWGAEGLQQQLVLVNPEALMEEDWLEGLAAILLQRYAEARRKATRQADPVEIPEWFSAGLARQTSQRLREEDVELIRRQAGGAAWNLGEVASWITLPAGPCEEKTVCGQVAGWLLAQPDRARILQQALQRCADGRGLDEAWLNAPWPAEAKGVARQDWAAWCRRKPVLRREGSAVEADQLEMLRQVLRVHPAAEGLPTAERLPDPLTPERMIDSRHEAWMPALAARLHDRVRDLPTGSVPELQPVIEAYAVFFAELHREACVGWLTRRLTRANSRAYLLQLLKAADRDAARMDRILRERRAFLDAWDARTTPPATAPTAIQPGQSPWQEYLDAWEASTRP